MLLESIRKARQRNILMALSGLVLGCSFWFLKIGGLTLPIILWVVSFWMAIYSSKFLVQGSVADIVLPATLLFAAPVLSICFVLTTDHEKIADALLILFEQELRAIFIGAASTANDLAKHGMVEQSREIKVIIATASPSWVIFGVWLLTAVLSSSGRVLEPTRIHERISILKQAKLACLLLLTLLFIPMLTINFYTENCSGRRCGLEQGSIFIYVLWYCVSAKFAMCTISSYAWLSISGSVLKSRYICE